MSRDNELRLQQNTEFARELGANIVTLSGEDIAFQVSEYAKKSQVTKIILGRSGYRPNRLFTPPNFVDKIIKYSPEIEIYIIPDKAQKMYFGQQENKKNKYMRSLCRTVRSSHLKMKNRSRRLWNAGRRSLWLTP